MVSYTADRITANVPFPLDATDIVFDQNRPYLGCIAPLALDATLDFFRKEMAAIGWKPLSAADITARWPNAKLGETVANGVRAYYSHDDGEGFYRQRPIMLTLLRRDDGRTGVEIRVAPFALPQTWRPIRDGCLPDRNRQGREEYRQLDSVRRQIEVAVIADCPRRLLSFATNSQAELERGDEGAVVTPDNVTLNFSSADQCATLRLGHQYDLTFVSLVTQMKESALAARARRKRKPTRGSSPMRRR